MAARKGKGTKVRWAVLPDGTTARPATADLRLITGMQTSEIRGNQEMDADPAGNYETVDDNLWRDGDSVRRVGWGFTLSGQELEDAAQVTELEAIWTAWSQGKKIWIERLKRGASDWKGGRAIVQDPTEPVPYDGEVTFSATFLGQGAIVKTAKVAGE